MVWQHLQWVHFEHTSRNHCSSDDKLCCQWLFLKTRRNTQFLFFSNILFPESDTTWWNIDVWIGLKELGVVSFLCHNNHEFRIPVIIHKLACLHYKAFTFSWFTNTIIRWNPNVKRLNLHDLLKLDVQHLIELTLADPIPKNYYMLWFKLTSSTCIKVS